MSKGSFKKKFDDQLTCSVCLEQYTNPKTLPCLHSFCLKCIQQLPVEMEDNKYYITCPNCRADHLVPQGGVVNLLNAFQINSFIDLRRKLSAAMVGHQTATCLHHNDPLKVYCETCSRVICRDCTITNEHNTHKFYLISECYPKYHQQIQDRLDLVKDKLTDVNTAVTHLDTREREVLQQGQQLKEQIDTQAQQIIDYVQMSCTRLSQQVDNMVQQKTETLTTQRQQAQKLHAQLIKCQELIEQILKEWTQQQILTDKHLLMDEMNTATQHVDPAVFQPIEEADVQFTRTKTNEIGLITSTIYGKATLEVEPSCLLPKQPSTATLILQSLDGSPFSLPPSLITSTLSSPGAKQSMKCDITQMDKGKYNITFTPSTRQDQLVVQVGGIDVPDSPFTPPVIPSPEMRDKPVNVITGLNGPWGGAVWDNGDIVVAENEAHCITIVNRMGKKVKSFGTKGKKDGQFKFPRGVAISNDGHILVTDNHRLQKLTTDGVCVKSVGSRNNGSGELQFDYPNGITVHPTTGQIFVADCFNNRIQVFTNDLAFSHTINCKIQEKKQDQLGRPFDVALDSNQYLYVAEFDNHCITKFAARGKFITRFGMKGSDPGQLLSPSSLVICDNLVYISELGNKQVSIFDTDGKFLHRFGKGSSAITADALGNLYVSDTSQNRILVY